jgi:hypothetical protein
MLLEPSSRPPIRAVVIGAFAIFTYYFIVIFAVIVYSLEIAHYEGEWHFELAAVFTFCVVGSMLFPLTAMPNVHYYDVLYESCFLAIVVFVCMQAPSDLEYVALEFMVVSLGAFAPLYKRLTTIQNACIVVLFIWISMMIFTAPACLKMEQSSVKYIGIDVETNKSYVDIETSISCTQYRHDYLYSFITIIVVGFAGWAAFFTVAESEKWFYH